MDQSPIRRSRLVKQESKRLTHQTIIIVVATIIFLVSFFTFGIPSLMKLAVAIGNSKANSKFTAIDDKIAPLPPQINPLPEATPSATINIEGMSESGSIVNLYVNDSKVAETTADNQGNYSFSDINLANDGNVLYATATDAAGNLSQKSVAQTIVVDNEPPTLSIDTPKDGDKLYGELKQIVDITGTTDPEAQLTINGRQVVVTADGSFSTKYSLQGGDNTLSFKAKDPAGNETTKDLMVNFSK